MEPVVECSAVFVVPVAGLLAYLEAVHYDFVYHVVVFGIVLA
ncbi:MAG: hypothetical protein Q4Q24_00570 [Methanobrevibacter ruminantium]|nr:hypothetical protein [Methanobrevibacter ruminantium]MDO5841748.1 hypothetical protein [Methanobrevibacter ruminantium]